MVNRQQDAIWFALESLSKGKMFKLFELLIIMSLLLITSIERNTCLIMDDSFPSTDLLSSCGGMTLKDKFSVVHCNVQSILNKVHLIESKFCNFDIICITESWLDGRASDDMLH